MSDPAARPPAAGPPAARPAGCRRAERFLTEFQASRSYLAGGLRGGGWLDFGQFNWHDVALGRAIRAALGVITPLPALDGLAAGLTEAAAILAGSLRAMRAPGPLPPLRQLQAAIIPGPDAASGALFAATDALVDAVNTAGDILRRHLERDSA